MNKKQATKGTAKSFNTRRINLVGVELEGGWNKKAPAPFGHDGSVTVSARWSGESASPAMKPQSLDAWLKANYPDAVNRSCGMHIHISFENHADYQRLMVPRFHRELKEAFLAWAESQKVDTELLRERIAGRNSFCADAFRAQEQYRAPYKTHARYCHLNYCFSLHGTIELRMLPMFQKMGRAKRAIRFYLQFVEEWLDKAYARDAARATRLEAHVAEILTSQDGNEVEAGA